MVDHRPYLLRRGGRGTWSTLYLGGCDEWDTLTQGCQECGGTLQAYSGKVSVRDIEIAFCESVFTRSAGPQFLKCNRYFDPSVPLANVRYSCTPTLGVPIAPKAFSQFGGTGRLYLREGGERNRVLLLTARHGVLPSSEYRNEFYERKMPRREVILLGNKAFENVLTSVMCKIGHGVVTVDHYKNSLAYLGETAEGEDATGVKMREQIKAGVEGPNLIGTLDKPH